MGTGKNWTNMYADWTIAEHEHTLNLTIILQSILKIHFRDREQYRSIKMDTEEDMNEMLRPSKQRAVVANSMFHKILDNVGLVAKDYNLGSNICLRLFFFLLMYTVYRVTGSFVLGCVN